MYQFKGGKLEYVLTLGGPAAEAPAAAPAAAAEKK